MFGFKLPISDETKYQPGIYFLLTFFKSLLFYALIRQNSKESFVFQLAEMLNLPSRLGLILPTTVWRPGWMG